MRLIQYMNNQDEINYIVRILAGETNLYSHFVNSYSNSIYSLIVRIVQTNEDAEELTQDSFLKAFKKLDSFKGDCSFSTWLFRIAYNTAISATRKRKMEFPMVDEVMMESVPDEAIETFFDGDENEIRLQKLEEAITKLNVEEKTLITLFYTEDKSVAELARVLDLTPENVKVKLHRVRKKLYVLMTKGNENEQR
ncbi:RNA polymerase, sigma-24 subunit, ECF subfamily [Paludibacter propionicigenes WB4]|uniref:RNA polymerase sigma factor n=2 Tax=Paludibacter TaxID=346096 RepID=E4T6A6_PALPW|nr:RNA polymerase, sigma-24 subunit, ECF subfamily [Paludibacter propionicigenes WB4]